MNCPECPKECCQKRLEEIGNANLSISWVVKQIAKGVDPSIYLERLGFENNRIDTAIKACHKAIDNE